MADQLETIDLPGKGAQSRVPDRLRALLEADAQTGAVPLSRGDKIHRTQYAKRLGCTPTALTRYIAIFAEFEQRLDSVTGPMRHFSDMKAWLEASYKNKELGLRDGKIERIAFCKQFGLSGGDFGTRYPAIQELLEKYDVRAARRPVPRDIPLKPPGDWRLIGTRVPRHDAPPKVFGAPIFASDGNLPDMLHAAVAACPSYGGKLLHFRADDVLKLPGVTHVAPVGDNAVAVVAPNWWQAKKGLDALTVEWDETPSAALTTDSMRGLFRAGLDAADAAIGHSVGDVDAVLASAAKRLDVEFEVPHLAHATMEPQTCTAQVRPDRVDVWAPTQNGEGTTAVVAATLGVEPSKVFVHKLHLGGGFGRRGLAQDWAQMSVLIAKAVGGQPVKMTWSREEDMAHDFYRPMVLARHTAGFDAAGRLLGWKVRLAGSSIAASLSPRWLRNGVDHALMDGF